MKQFGLFILSILLVFSIFGWWNADISNNCLILAAMVLLLTLFDDLKEFDFWGLKGKKQERQLKQLEGTEAIDETSAPNPNAETVREVQETQLMEPSLGDFLMIAFEIEKLLKVAEVIIFSKEEKHKSLANIKKLLESGFLTEDGAKQVESVRWLRNMFVHGRLNEVNQDTVNSGIKVAWNLYTELNNWVNSTNNKTNANK